MITNSRFLKIAHKGFFIKENLFSIFKNNNSKHGKLQVFNT